MNDEGLAAEKLRAEKSRLPISTGFRDRVGLFLLDEF